MVKLNEYQEKFINVPLKQNQVYLLQAVPGSGKSTTIAYKIKDLVSNHRVNPESIVTVTFSNRASRDLSKKCNNLVKVTTIHSMMINLIKEHTGNRPVVLNDWNSLLILRYVLEQAGFEFDNKRELTKFAYQVREYIDYYRINHFNTNISKFKLSDYFSDFAISSKVFRTVYKMYEDIKRDRGVWDYQDLISDRAINCLDLNRIRNKIKYVITDESQDNDPSQYHLYDRVFGNQIALVLVADTMQKIYAWRYADTHFIEDDTYFLNKGFKKVNRFKLLHNYRSTNNIVKVFNAHRHQHDQISAISTVSDVKGSVKLCTVKSSVDEGVLVAKMVNELHKSGIEYSDMVVLSRKNSHIKSFIEPAMISHNIPYQIITPQHRKKLFEVPINKLYLSFLNYIANSDILSILSVVDLFKGIGKSTKSKLIDQYFKGELNISSPVILKVIKRLDAISNDDDLTLNSIITEIKSLVLEFVKESEYTLKKIDIIERAIFSYVMIITDGEIISDIKSVISDVYESIGSFDELSNKGVKLSNTFQWKGLESPVVFVVDLTYTGNFSDSGSESEIVYVSLSRAKDKLIVIDSEYTIWRGKYIKSKINPFYLKTKRRILEGLA